MSAHTCCLELVNFVSTVLTESVEIGGRQVYQFKTPTKARQMVQKGKANGVESYMVLQAATINDNWNNSEV